MQIKKKEIEYEKLKDCSFRPWLNDSDAFETKCQKGEVYVRGLSSYLSKQQHANKKKEEKEAREKEVFGMAAGGQLPNYCNLKRDQRGCLYTKAQPFNLREDDKEKIQKLKQKIHGEEKRKCPFKPNTMEGNNRKNLKKMLENDKEVEEDT